MCEASCFDRVWINPAVCFEERIKLDKSVGN